MASTLAHPRTHKLHGGSIRMEGIGAKKRHLYIQTIFLPRQARDKHTKSCEQEAFSEPLCTTLY